MVAFPADDREPWSSLPFEGKSGPNVFVAV
jgi:hypothetical protein